MSEGEGGGSVWFKLFRGFILILIGLWILWYYTGGPQRAVREGDKPFLKPLEPIDSGQPYSVTP